MNAAAEGRGFLLSTLVIFLCLSLPNFGRAKCKRNPVIFNFGDSNSDNGGVSAGFGVVIPHPEGRTFFHKPSGRYCDGRQLLDFLCESLNTSYLSPYLDSLNPNFTNGANFAVSGASLNPPFNPFNLAIQVSQFIHFQTRSKELTRKGLVKDLVRDHDYKDALYMIDIGENDVAVALGRYSYEQAVSKFPSFISEIEIAIWRLHQRGARNFWVNNLGPMGCWPQTLATSNASGGCDQYGCLRYFNNGVEEYNHKLSSRLDELRHEIEGATIVYVDIYTPKYELVANASTYGFENPLTACCGYGGPPYNYNDKILCGGKGHNTCKEGSNYISWDGVHYTEAANSIIASKLLSAMYSQPRVKFDFFCNTRVVCNFI